MVWTAIDQQMEQAIKSRFQRGFWYKQRLLEQKKRQHREKTYIQASLQKTSSMTKSRFQILHRWSYFSWVHLTYRSEMPFISRLHKTVVSALDIPLIYTNLSDVTTLLPPLQYVCVNVILAPRSGEKLWLVIHYPPLFHLCIITLQ